MNNAMKDASQEVSNDFSTAHNIAAELDVPREASAMDHSDKDPRGVEVSKNMAGQDTPALENQASSAIPDSSQQPQKAHQDIEAASPESPYSIFTPSEKRLALIMAALSAIISPLSSSIYLPALNTLSHHYNISNSLINLTVTSYLIFQGVGPTIFGDLADQAGRRTAYLIAFGIYLVTNVALALQNSYAALLVLRMLQSTGASASVVICMGVIADLTVTAERGFYLGLVFGGTMFGPAIAPVIGGILSQYLGWRSIFWFLVIVVGLFLIPFTIFVPETCRKIVGNGSIPAQGLNLSLRNLLKTRKNRKSTLKDASHQALRTHHHPCREKAKFRLPNPLGSLKLIFEKDVAIILFYNSIVYMTFVAINTSTPSIFASIYAYNDLLLGLCYIPYATGGITSSILIGRLLDQNYRRIAHLTNFPISYQRGADLRSFPIELARLQIMAPLLVVAVLGTIGYGWAMNANVEVASALVLQFILGFSLTGILQVSTTLLVDLYPMSPATVSGSNNLIRCCMGAVSTAVLNPLLEGIGRGWTFTLFASLAAVLSPGLVVLVKRGPGWREERRVRIERRVVEREKNDSPRDVRGSGS